jgi:2-C-methyl-D-erythritol 4-phosphate cytidylyltransferase
MTAERVWAVVAAAGDGRRLGHELPKAFVKLGGRPLLAHAIELFEAHPRVERMVVVVPEGWEEPTALLADELAAGKVAASVAGGATRALSVAAGLAEVSESATAILVHDAARPFASDDLVDRVLDALEAAEGAVPGLALADTVKRVGGGAVVETLDRGELRAVQTPQAFRAEALQRAYAGAAADIEAATDCAQLVERAGGRVVVVDGEAANAKITGPDDLAGAETRIAERT